MNEQGAVTARSAVASDVAGGENVDKIRDILFGNQMREYERRFSRMEERLGKEVGRVREEVGQRLDALERYVNQELESLGERIKAEQNDRLEAQRGLGHDLDKRIGDMESRLGTSTRELRQQILDQSKRLGDELSARHEETTRTLDEVAGELREQKVNRSTLSALLTELALRLSEETPIESGGAD